MICAAKPRYTAAAAACEHDSVTAPRLPRPGASVTFPLHTPREVLFESNPAIWFCHGLWAAGLWTLECVFSRLRDRPQGPETHTGGSTARVEVVIRVPPARSGPNTDRPMQGRRTAVGEVCVFITAVPITLAVTPCCKRVGGGGNAEIKDQAPAPGLILKVAPTLAYACRNRT